MVTSYIHVQRLKYAIQIPMPYFTIQDCRIRPWARHSLPLSTSTSENPSTISGQQLGAEMPYGHHHDHGRSYAHPPPTGEGMVHFEEIVGAHKHSHAWEAYSRGGWGSPFKLCSRDIAKILSHHEMNLSAMTIRGWLIVWLQDARFCFFYWKYTERGWVGFNG